MDRSSTEISSSSRSGRITSYNVCYTKLLRAGRSVRELHLRLHFVHILASGASRTGSVKVNIRQIRITSYNVCYTKLLRSSNGKETQNGHVGTSGLYALSDLNTNTDKAVSRKDRAMIVRDRFYSPLVRNMAKAEHISKEELDTVPGTGKEGRVTKKDMIRYLKARENEGGSHKSNGSSLGYKRPEIKRPSSIPPPEIHEDDEVSYNFV